MATSILKHLIFIIYSYKDPFYTTLFWILWANKNHLINLPEWIYNVYMYVRFYFFLFGVVKLWKNLTNICCKKDFDNKAYGRTGLFK